MADELLTDQVLAEMVKKGLLKQKDIEEAKHSRSDRGVRYIDFLLSTAKITPQALLSFIGSYFNIPVVDPNTYIIHKEVLDLVPQKFAEKHHLIPLVLFGGTLTIATSNPLNVIVLDDLRAICSLEIKAAFALPDAIDKAIESLYVKGEARPEKEEDFEELVKEVQDAKTSKKDEEIQVDDLARLAQETPVIKVTSLLIMEAIKRRASDLYIEPSENILRCRVRVDGLLEEIKSPPKSMAPAIVSRIKVMSTLDIAERRLPQDGRFRIKVQNRDVDFRVSVVPVSFGEKVSLRLLDKQTQVSELDKIGYYEDDLIKIKRCADKPHGMILATGPTGCGKTSTLYAILNYLHTPEKNITTVEDPVEYQVDGINQVAIREHIGLTFAACLRSILRQDPDIIMVGEIRDFETIDIAIKAALTGHLVLSTIHTNDACSSVTRMINMGIEPFLISSSLLAVISQRLVRKLCPNCKESFKPEPSVLREIGLKDLPKGGGFFKAVGCDSCRQTGYSGRTAIEEILVLDVALRDAIMRNVTAEELKRVARKSGMRSLRECGVRKVLDGETSLDEVLRITAPDEDVKS